MNIKIGPTSAIKIVVGVYCSTFPLSVKPKPKLVHLVSAKLSSLITTYFKPASMAPASTNVPVQVETRPGKRKRSSARVASRSAPDAEPELLGATLPAAGPSALNTLPAAAPSTRDNAKGRKSARLQPARAPSADSDIVVVDPPPPMASLPLETPTPPDVKPNIAFSAGATPIASSSALPPGPASRGDSEVKMTEEEYDIQHHKQITAKRNFDKVNFGQWQIKAWYVACQSICEVQTRARATGTSHLTLCQRRSRTRPHPLATPAFPV